MSEGEVSKITLDEDVDQVAADLITVRDLVNQAATNINIGPVSSCFDDRPDVVNLRVRQVSLMSTFIQYKLACLLFRVDHDNLWRMPKFCLAADKYVGFSSWAEGELKISGRLARYLRDVAEKLYTLKVDAGTTKDIFLLGWTKAYEILRASDNERKLLEWKVMAEDMGVRDLHKMVQLSLQAPAASGQGEEGIPEPAEGRLKAGMREEIFFSRAENYMVFKRAVSLVKRKYGRKVRKSEDVITVIAAHYVASTLPVEPEGSELPMEIDSLLRIVEAATGRKIKVQLDDENED